jgi:TM2 domain-containing membrane protein YozV
MTTTPPEPPDEPTQPDPFAVPGTTPEPPPQAAAEEPTAPLPPPAWQQQPPPPGYQQPPAYGQQPYGQPQGYGQPAPPYGMADPQAKSKLAAGLLGIFLGGFGVHRFYLGFTKIGVIQLIVTLVTCGLGSIWGFIEGILYLVGANGYTTDADGRPLRD